MDLLPDHSGVVSGSQSGPGPHCLQGAYLKCKLTSAEVWGRGLGPGALALHMILMGHWLGCLIPGKMTRAVEDTREAQPLLFVLKGFVG